MYVCLYVYIMYVYKKIFFESYLSGYFTLHIMKLRLHNHALAIEAIALDNSADNSAIEHHLELEATPHINSRGKS